MRISTSLSLLVLGLSLSTAGVAQTAQKTEAASKFGLRMHKLLQEKAAAERTDSNAPRLLGAVTPSPLVHSIVSCTSSIDVQRQLDALGITSTVITDKVLTARIPLDKVHAVAEIAEIVKFDAPLRYKRMMTEARAKSKVDAVHAGTNLDTPYDGTGVIVAVIDQGFEYIHPAFRKADGTSRIVYLWNHLKGHKAPLTTSAAILAAKNDGEEQNHATHVAGIAAGSKVAGSQNYGMAPGATLMFFPSTFEDAEILEDVKIIKEYAQQKGMPWVTNMSFGASVGPHDGSTPYDQALSSFVSNGGMVVAAMGNENENNLHLGHTFGENDTLYAVTHLVRGDSLGVDIWCEGGNVQVDMFEYDKTTATFNYRTKNFWTRNKFMSVSQDMEQNGKQRTYVTINHEALGEYEENGDYPFISYDTEVGLRLIAPRGTVLHAWLDIYNDDQGYWKKVDAPKFGVGDNRYCVAEGGASSEKVIAVGSYNTTTEWTSLGNKKMQAQSGELGEGSTFSNRGPQVHKFLPKPAVVAPGSMINSAYGKYVGFDEDTDTQDEYIVNKVNVFGGNFYYGMQEGTSMSTPAVTGIVALWLQAYPQLSHEQLLSVLRTTSMKDSFTGSEEWSDKMGYGKIDAYEGLKAVLRIKNGDLTGVYQVRNTELPLTFRSDNRTWQLLFNSNESFADIAVYSLSGTKVLGKRLADIHSGQEEILSLENLPAGVYTLRVATADSNYTRKVVVK